MNLSNSGIPAVARPKSTAIIGEPGTGKTELNRQIRTEDSDKDILIDCDSEFTETDYKKTDLILSENALMSESYSCLAEIWRQQDAGLVSRSMIPSAEGEAKSWHQMTQQLTSDILWQVRLMGQSTNQELMYFICMAPISELKQLLKSTESSRFFESGSEKMLSNILAIMASYCSPMKYLKPTAGINDFSLREWILDDEEKGNLFLPYVSN